MNYLSHAALSPYDTEVLIGNLIADHVKGTDLSRFPDAIANGIQLHRFIDRTFDSHPNIVALRAVLPNGQRRFSGICIDFWFDHFLANDWPAFFEVDLEDFVDQLSHNIQTHWQWIPESQQRFMNYLISENLLQKYQHKKTIESHVTMVANRLSRPEGLLISFESTKRLYPQIQQQFRPVFEDMQKAVGEFVLS